jgi:hypothetical protein
VLLPCGALGCARCHGGGVPRESGSRFNTLAYCLGRRGTAA